MADSIHNRACIAAQEKNTREREEWAAAWPRHCTTCEGWGGVYSTYDPSPAGVALSSGWLEDFDSCAVCVDKGNCPRCGAEDAFDPESESVQCRVCGWQEGHGQPPVFDDCGCWCAEEEKLLREAGPDRRR